MDGIFDAMADGAHEAVLFVREPEAGLQAIIAVHSTVAGPAVGGTRMRPYPTERDALRDVLALARDMTFKAAIHRMPLGGGKAVIIGDPATDKSPALLRAFGRAVDRLGGGFVASEDVGIGSADVEIVREATDHVTTPPGPPGSMSDPPFGTAYGVVVAMRAAARLALGREDLEGARIAVQGAGAVGSWVCRLLADAGASVDVADVDVRRATAVAEASGARVISSRSILETECDVFAPCALGGLIDEHAVDRLRCRAVVGAANNVLADPALAVRLHRRGIFYAPDFVVNSGGMAQEAALRAGWSDDQVRAQIEQIAPILAEVHARAVDGDTHRAAVELALEQLR